MGTAGVVSLGAIPPRFLARAAEVPAGAAAPDQRVLVLIQLAGGNDGLNTLIPSGIRPMKRLDRGSASPRDRSGS